MSFFRRRHADSLESDLRRHRPEPREDFVRQLEARIAADRTPAPSGRGAGRRLGLAVALTAALIVVASVMGGVGYAASSVTHAAHAVAVVFKFTPHQVGAISSAAADQYGKVTLCHNGHEISISQNAVPAHLAQGDTIGACPVFAPPTILAAGSTTDLSKTRTNAVIVATKGDNSIKTNNKDNKVTTGAGSDVITTGKGTNLVKSGAGADTIKSNGKDTIFSGAGNDTINVRNGKTNFVNCGSGRDVVIADPTNLDFVGNSCEVVRRAKFKK
jgi:hypothetical protein